MAFYDAPLIHGAMPGADPVDKSILRNDEKGYVDKIIHIHEFSKVTRTKHASRQIGRDITGQELKKYAEPIKHIREYNRKVGS